ncbi:MAG TPA: thioredoxin family protein [Tepidisphaeraceae bacterium]|jgi:thiol:disulfide interchange protein DsbD|nr:thioredoxin family protein [Tepidisphaeraceae bacterium]
MASTLPPNVPPPDPKKPSGASASPNFSTGIPSGPSAPSGAGFTTHIPQLRNTFPTPPDNADHSAYYASLNPKPGMSGRTKGILVAILVFCGFFGWRAWRGGHALAAWGGNWEKQVDQSESQKKPQLVLFTADWCPACEDFEDKVLSRKDVEAKLQEQFILTKIDLTERGGPNNQIAATFGVKVIPTLVIVGPDGSRSDFLTGSVPAERLYDWIENRKMKKPR